MVTGATEPNIVWAMGRLHPLAFLPPMCVFLLTLLIRSRMPGAGWRASLLRASLGCAAFAVVSAELASLGSWITQGTLALAWTIACVGLAVLVGRRVDLLGSLVVDHRRWIADPWTRMYLMICAVVLLIVAVSAVATPPVTWDVMNYHLSRVAHWAQNRSLAPFATGIEWQNGFSPGAELLVLHAYVLSGSDALSSLPQWSALLGSAIAISLVVSRLGGGPAAQAAGALAGVTVPMALIEATSAKNDLLASYWLLCVAVEALALLKTPRDRVAAGSLALAVSMAILTKATTFPFLLPLGLLTLVALARARSLRVIAAASGLVVFAIALLNAGYVTRNMLLYQYPLGVPGLASVHRNELLSLEGLASNTLKHASIHSGTPWPEINDFIYRGVVKAHLLMGVDPNDERSTVMGPWTIRAPSTEEATSGNSAHAYLLLGVFTILPFLRRRLDPATFAYAGCVVGGFLLFAWTFKYTIYCARYHLMFFELASPILGIALAHGQRLAWRRLLPIGLAIASIPWILSVQNRPLVPLAGWTSNPSVLSIPRNEALAGSDEAYASTSTMILASHCGDVGLMLGGNSTEYAVWVLLGAPRDGLRLEWIVAGTPSAKYEDPTFTPCAVVCQYCPSEWEDVRGLPIAYDNPPFRLFLGDAGQ